MLPSHLARRGKRGKGPGRLKQAPFAEESSAGLGPGYVVDGRFELIECLSVARETSAWRARHVRLDSVLFLRVLTGRASPRAIDAWITDAAGASHRCSPNAVSVYDSGWDAEGRAYVASEWVPGLSVADWLGRGKKLDRGALASVAKQLGKALNRAHKHGIIHGCLSPRCLRLVSSDGDLLLVLEDFGLRHVARSGYATPSDPSRPVGATPDSVVDRWVMACLLAELVVGKPLPSSAPLSLLSLAPDLSDAVEGWWRAVVADDPAVRLQSAEQIGVSFAAALTTADSTDERTAINVAPPAPDGSLETPGIRSYASSSHPPPPSSSGNTLRRQELPYHRPTPRSGLRPRTDLEDTVTKTPEGQVRELERLLTTYLGPRAKSVLKVEIRNGSPLPLGLPELVDRLVPYLPASHRTPFRIAVRPLVSAALR